MWVAKNTLELIGRTPMVELTRVDTGPCRLFVKLEDHNPGGSIKDRIALSMITAAEEEGKLKPGMTIIEATAGNTGIGLAVVAAFRGYKLIVVIPDKMSKEKIYHLKALGAKTIITRSDVYKGHPEHYQEVAKTLVLKTPNSFFVNQFSNPANPRVHELTTGPEIWQQMEQKLDAFIYGVGSGGALTGISHFLKKVQPNIEIVIADPQGSIIADYVNHRKKTFSNEKWLVEGIGEDYIPDICDLSLACSAITVNDHDSFFTAREILQKEGLIVGASAGTMICAALRYCRKQTQPKRVATIICDTGNKYLSKMYNDDWLIEKGLMST